mmetsp:Transcript_59002/g.131519  ORF Transcript_59002/g.131519 Transcript_59002/m.131519 type:complete len:176 (-) Transcript_59002:356-883(-)
MDMLLIGAISQGRDGGQAGKRCVTLEEEKTQMAIWAISASPLIMGNDLRHIADDSKAILLNEQAIAVSQDPLGQMGRRRSPSKTDSQQLWSRNLANGDVAVALYNKGLGQDPGASSSTDITITFADVNLFGSVSVYDIWSQSKIGNFSGSFTAKAVPHHGSAFLRLTGTKPRQQH